MAKKVETENQAEKEIEKEKENQPETKEKFPRIAMIDVDRVVAKSAMVKKLKTEYDKQNKEIERWIKNVKKQIEKPDSKAVQAKLIKRYDEEFAQKKEEIAKEFREKLKVVNANVTSQISKIAKENNYDIILSKAIVVLGCDDITEIVEKQIK